MTYHCWDVGRGLKSYGRNPVPVKGNGFFIGPLSHYSQSFQWRSPEIQPQYWVPNHGKYPSDAFPNNRGSGKWPFLEVHSLKLTTYLWKEVFPNGKFIFQPPIFQVQNVSFRKGYRPEGFPCFTSNDWRIGSHPICEVETMCLSQPGGCLLYRSLTIEADSFGKETMLSVSVVHIAWFEKTSDVKYDESVAWGLSSSSFFDI